MRDDSSHRLRTGLLGAGAALALAAAGLAGALARPGDAAHAVKVVTVTEKEFSLTPSTRKLAAGKVTFVARNRGRFPHALEVAGPGVKARTKVLSPGRTARLTVTLRKGAYTMWCPIGNHAALGMRLTLHVGGSTATAAPVASTTPAPSTTAPATTTTSSGGGGAWG